MSSKSHVLMSWSPGMASLGGAGIFERWGPVGGLKVTGIVPSEISSHRPFEFSWQGCRESPSLGPPTLCGPPGSPCDVFPHTYTYTRQPQQETHCWMKETNKQKNKKICGQNSFNLMVTDPLESAQQVSLWFIPLISWSASSSPSSSVSSPAPCQCCWAGNKR